VPAPNHKTTIIRKVLSDKKDSKTVAPETQSFQQAVDGYLKDFYRVQTW